MAYNQERPRKNGPSAFQVRWREGGGRGGDEQSGKFADRPSAEKFQALVDAHDQHWPHGWVKG
ncbi:hypothetical protein [Streptomyces sp. NPDC005322]|uniref:hypothetical protein n=1 Tax=Streptomyces sp. NPDC005322 TaxID=3157032 RepID=UPI00339F0044